MKNAFFASEEHKKYDLWSCQKVTAALIYLLDNIYIRFGSKLYRQNVGIPMGTNCAPVVADLFLFCYERDFMNFIILILLIFRSLMAMSLNIPLMVYIYLNFFALPEHRFIMI